MMLQREFITEQIIKLKAEIDKKLKAIESRKKSQFKEKELI